MEGLMEGYADGRTDGSLDVRIKEEICGWTDVYADERTNGSLDVRINRGIDYVDGLTDIRMKGLMEIWM
jgi:hypothetical protein